MLASRAARNPETAATMPWRSGQEMSRRASMGAGGYLAASRMSLAHRAALTAASREGSSGDWGAGGPAIALVSELSRIAPGKRGQSWTVGRRTTLSGLARAHSLPSMRQ